MKAKVTTACKGCKPRGCSFADAKPFEIYRPPSGYKAVAVMKMRLGTGGPSVFFYADETIVKSFVYDEELVMVTEFSDGDKLTFTF